MPDKTPMLTRETLIPVGAALAVTGPVAFIGIWLISTLGDLEHSVDNLVKSQAAMQSQITKMEAAADSRDRDVVHIHQIQAWIRLARAANADGGVSFPDF